MQQLEDKPAPSIQPAKSGWIERWDPEDPDFWAASGQRIARKNLAISMLTDHLGFCLWVVWTTVVLNLGDVGIVLPVSDLFLLTLLPNLIGSLLRIPYTFAVSRFGGRAWTTASGLVLLVPAVLLAVVVPSHWLLHQDHSTQMWVLGLCAATSGFGGGNFASSMANISHFYPQRRQGWALGMNAAGGNVGSAVSQLVVPLAVIVGVPYAAAKLPAHQVHLAYAGLIWIPFIIVAAILAWRYMDSLSTARSDGSSYRRALGNPHTWVLSFIYIGTFGSFIGFSFALPLVIKNSFPLFLAHHPFIATYLAGLGFTGALVGSLARPVGGWLADRIGGPIVSVTAFAGMAVFTGTAILGVEQRSFVGFFASFQVIFILTGIGNGSTYKMIPTVVGRSAGREGDERQEARRRAAAAIGIAGSVGALGGVAVQVVIRQASLHVSKLIAAAKTPAAKQAVAVAHATWSVPALWAFLGSYVVFAAVTWLVYAGPDRRRIPAGVTTSEVTAGAA